jgi:diaminohydroxyphosphoribosylaminopyrimidine deaminase/5-amino-6-(5-phosphoribosylamino)uracil reductase
MTGSPSAGPAADERWMRLALALGARNLGLAWPNPSVGAVVVAGTGEGARIVGQGVTQAGGRPHAERVALDAAGAAARNATLYVTLEPCSHVGRTGPCADAAIEAGVARVVSALEDPDPRVAGRGHARLEAAGVEVVRGVLVPEARRAHRGHILRVTEGRPSVLLKLARTADGYAARADGARLMITGEAANGRVHLMRAHADAILVGIGTALADDPLLTVRLPGLEHRSPVRVVLDGRLRLPPRCRLADASRVPTWVIAAEDAPAEAERRLVGQGVEVMRVGRDGQGRVDAAQALRLLGARGITRVFCEGGPQLGEALAAAGLVDELATVTSPAYLNEPGLQALGPALLGLVAEGVLARVSRERAGPDLIETYARNP